MASLGVEIMGDVSDRGGISIEHLETSLSANHTTLASTILLHGLLLFSASASIAIPIAIRVGIHTLVDMVWSIRAAVGPVGHTVTRDNRHLVAPRLAERVLVIVLVEQIQKDVWAVELELLLQMTAQSLGAETNIRA